VKVGVVLALLALAVLPAALHAAPVDPRAGGLTVAMGEWTLVPEAKAIRPGEVTFVVTNRGTFAHGFRIRSEGSGHDRFEARSRLLAPGETARLTVTLAAGAYSLECFVEDVHGDHEALGMRAPLDVRADAPFVNPPKRAAANRLRIASFRFQPAAVTVKPGATLTWVNQDPAQHTVSATNGSFTSKALRQGQSYSRTFTRVGSFAYLCAIHPSMKARVIVRR